MAEQKVKPESTSKVVDLGFAVARVKHNYFADPHAESGWRRVTMLTLMTPADSDENIHQPAASCIATLNPSECRALIEALS